MKRIITFILLLSIFNPQKLSAQASALDNTFNAGNGADDDIHCALSLPDGKILIGGEFTTYNGTQRNRVARLNSNGTLDLGFNANTAALTKAVGVMVLQADGKILIGGSFSKGILRLNADGTLDNTFNSGGIGAAVNPGPFQFDPTVVAIAIQTDGKILIGGIFDQFNGISKTSFTRLNANGTLDGSFNQPVLSSGGFPGVVMVASIQIESSGKYYVCGYIDSCNGSLAKSIVRLNANGTRDAIFSAGGGIGVSPETPLLHLQSTGKLIVTGHFNKYDATTVGNLVRLNANGTPDLTFNSGTGFEPASYSVRAMLDKQDRLICTGGFTSYNGQTISRLCRLNADGVLDNSLISPTINGGIALLAIQPDGKVLLSATAGTIYNGTTVNSIFRINGASFAPQPTAPATNILSSNVLSTTATLNWTIGSGERRIVIAKAGGAVSRFPKDSDDYVSDDVFGSGDNLGDSNFVVYDGDGSMVTVTGLKPSTIYYFAVFEYNGAGQNSTNYLLNPYPTTFVNTIAVEPAVSASNISFANIGPASADVTWTKGNAANRIVIVKQGSPVDALPDDGMPYVANSFFGMGSALGFGNYVVYAGSGNSFQVKGLNPFTAYHFTVIEYNGTEKFANYLTTGIPTGNFTTLNLTLNPEPLFASTNMQFSNVTATAMTVSFTAGNGSKRLVICKQGRAVKELPADGVSYNSSSIFGGGYHFGDTSYAVYDGSGNSFEVSGLAPDSTYHFAVFDYNGNSPNNNYLVTQYLGGSRKTLSNTAIREAGMPGRLSVFPNPSSGAFHIGNCGSSNITAVILYDITGKEVERIENEGLAQLVIEPGRPGIYMLMIRLGDGSAETHKIVSQKDN